METSHDPLLELQVIYKSFANFIATHFCKERKSDLKDKKEKVKSPSLDQVDSSLVDLNKGYLQIKYRRLYSIIKATWHLAGTHPTYLPTPKQGLLKLEKLVL